MSNYKELKEYANSLGLTVIEDYDFKCSELSGLINGEYIYLSSKLDTVEEKFCILAEEISHYLISYGKMTDLRDTSSRKQETRAHRFATKKFLVTFEKLVDTIIELKEDASYFNIAKKLGITEQWLKETIYFYSEVHHEPLIYKEHIITFTPFNVRSIYEVT